MDIGLQEVKQKEFDNLLKQNFLIITIMNRETSDQQDQKDAFDFFLSYIIIQNIIEQTLLLQTISMMPISHQNQNCNPNNKIYPNAETAVQDIPSNSFLLIGGFGVCGVPNNLIHAIKEKGINNLTIAANSGSYNKEENIPIGVTDLIHNRQVKRIISSYMGDNQIFQQLYFNGGIEFEVCPLGTLAEKIRLGAAGIPAFYTPTGVNTLIEDGGFTIKYKSNQNGCAVIDQQGKRIPEIVAEPKRVEYFNGKKYLLEQTFFADYALIKAKKADKMGNLIFNKAAVNFNADMAKAAKHVIVEAEEIVQIGQIGPNQIHVSGLYVDRVFLSDCSEVYSKKIIQKLLLSDFRQIKLFAKESDIKKERLVFNNENILTPKYDIRVAIANRGLEAISNGKNVNLGIGIPTLLSSIDQKGKTINWQSQNGIFGMGPAPTLKFAESDSANAGKQSITINPGGSFFSLSQSFTMIKGGHLDITILGAHEVSMNGDIANWMIPGDQMRGMGGAMDLVASGSKVVVLMRHIAQNRKGKTYFKLVKECNLPVTGRGIVSKVITQFATFDLIQGHLVLTQLAADKSLQEIQSLTQFEVICCQNLRRF